LPGGGGLGATVVAVAVAGVVLDGEGGLQVHNVTEIVASEQPAG
jgi:hypothetical protein